VTIKKGQPWGEPGALPDDGVVARSDAEARAAVATARAAGAPLPVIGLLGGDLCRTMGGRGDEARLRSPDAMTFPVDLGLVEADGRSEVFVAHVVARNRLWTRAVVALNAQWVGSWDLGPRSHPDDALLDVYEADLHLGDLRKVRARLPTGSHLPHPRIGERRGRSIAVTLDRPLDVWLDGEPWGRAASFEFYVEPDALTVVV
jgi:hypothetical protein